jgi:rRNA processing protein Gar1
MMKDTAADVTLASIGNKVIAAGTASAAYGGFTANEIAAIGGFVVAVIGLVVQIYFKVKADRRAAELHKKRIERLWDSDEDV